jgi:hypothetical protein
MRSPTVAPAKPTWRVASTLARRRYLGWRDEFCLGPTEDALICGLAIFKGPAIITDDQEVVVTTAQSIYLAVVRTAERNHGRGDWERGD